MSARTTQEGGSVGSALAWMVGMSILMSWLPTGAAGSRLRSLPEALRGISGAATASRLGGEALRGFTDGASLDAYERKLAASLRAGVLGLSLLAAWLPRLLAWPLAATGIAWSGLGLLRTARKGSSEVPLGDDPPR